MLIAFFENSGWSSYEISCFIVNLFVAFGTCATAGLSVYLLKKQLHKEDPSKWLKIEKGYLTNVLYEGTKPSEGGVFSFILRGRNLAPVDLKINYIKFDITNLKTKKTLRMSFDEQDKNKIYPVNQLIRAYVPYDSDQEVLATYNIFSNPEHLEIIKDFLKELSKTDIKKIKMNVDILTNVYGYEYTLNKAEINESIGFLFQNYGRGLENDKES